jgi:hypothetical protein
MTPFFDTRDRERIQFALNILNYPQHYCLKASNQPNLTTLLPASPGVHRLVMTLKAAQQMLAAHPPMSADKVWQQREDFEADATPSTVCVAKGRPEEATTQLHYMLNLGLVEAVVERVAEKVTGALTPMGLKLATACVWLSHHLALVALGVAKANLTAGGELVIEPASEEVAQHLRRLWFATAFEESSLRKAHADLGAYAYLRVKGKQVSGDLRVAFAHALAVIPQQWRLPFDAGPVDKLKSRFLLPLIELVGMVHESAFHQGGKPLHFEDLPSNAPLQSLFAEVLEHQRNLVAMDRLFHVDGDGLLPGSRKMAHGLLLVSEHLAMRQLGPTWHNAVSAVQKQHIFERLRSLDHVDVIDVVVSQDDNNDKVHVDVDFLVRDRQRHIVFAVQLKHFEFSNRGGIRGWLERFRPGRLTYGITQLQAIKVLAHGDSRTRALLLANGVTEVELQGLVPVVLHNIGVLDFLCFEGGALLYDQNTFINVLEGRSAGEFRKDEAGNIRYSQTLGKPTMCRLDDPDSVIAAYLSDERFRALWHFDFAASVERKMLVLGQMVIARGLGV